MKPDKLIEFFKLGQLELSNRIVMAPMTRCRAIDNIPNDLMAKYYKQRSDAGLIITEGTSPSPNGLGYARIPGIFTKEQVLGWRKVTDSVHAKQGKIFIQLMHCGRISHPLNMAADSHILAPSAIKASGQMWTDAKQLQDYVVPKEMTLEDIELTREEYVAASLKAVIANFDGVELHGANGYLLEEFLSPVSNKRKDKYGGAIENRCRFVLEVVAAVAGAIGKEKTGIRLSPYGVASDMPHYPEIHDTYDYLSTELDKLGIAYIHLVDHSAMGAPPVPLAIKEKIRQNFTKAIISCGGFDLQTAEVALSSGLCDLIAFGRPFIGNPDLVERMLNEWQISTELKMDLFYTAGKEGYTDYPTYKSNKIRV